MQTATAPLPFDRTSTRRLIEASISMQPDWRFAAVRLTVVALLVATAVWSALTGTLVGAIVAVAIMGVVHASLVYGQHECVHRGLFRHRWINDVAGLLMGVVMGVPYAGYRRYHLHHHAHTHAADDTEPALVLTSVGHWAGYMFLAAHGQRLSSLAALPSVVRSRNRTSVVLGWASIGCVAAMVGLGAWAAVFHTRLFLLLWLLPWILGAPFMAYITLADHYACAWGPDEAVRTTRSTDAGWFSRFVAWDGNFHAEHHLSAGVPTASLAAMHEQLAPYLAHRQASYLGFHRDLVVDLWRKRLVAPPPWVDAPAPAPAPALAPAPAPTSATEATAVR